MLRKITLIVLILTSYLTLSLAQEHNHDHHNGHSHHAEQKHDHSHDHDHGHNHSHANHAHANGSHGEKHGHGHESHSICGVEVDHSFDLAGTVIHHIGDANVYSILDWIRIPLPMILKSEKGWDFFLSNKFAPGHHENGHKAYNGYVMYHGSVHRVAEPGFPMEGSVDISGVFNITTKVDNKDVDTQYVCYNNHKYKLDERTTLDGGLLGGGVTSFWDFSITKNVVAIFIVCFVLFFMFRKAAKRYISNPLSAPKGIQGYLEPLVLFVRDEIAIPFIGKKKYEKYLSFLLSVFFFIFGLNLFGQIPFFGSVNATGNLTLTLVLALIVFIIVNVSGNKHYWGHIFWNPDAPVLVKLLLAPVELIGIFIKPTTLMLRLAGNISAGHIALVSFIGLIFIFSKGGINMGGGVVGTFLGVPISLFMMAIELLVAFVQAFVFTILAASYIGVAVEEHEHH